MRGFERTYEVGRPDDARHHEEVPSVQKAFAKDVKSLIGVIEENGNPFCEDSVHLLVLDTKKIMPECDVEAVSGSKVKGQSMYDKYVKERLNKRSRPITDTKQQCNLPFLAPLTNAHHVTGNQVAELKSDWRLFFRLYIAKRERKISKTFSNSKIVQIPPRFRSV